ncbi:IclR family transcriptional regulator domain-containing protein [Streptomyces purpureus]|uniref:IclR family transcriptional regulator domain-containing protein n=1 Tax=Streptomyces purpureus TaxID=1951 RepID=UPI00037C13F5|nr:IclR family transcriptional regulator C-terminal domain-containing protein [Streptomyces purpureus]
MSRNDSGRGAGPGPVVPAGLAALLSGLRGPSDFWDRPEGDWGRGADRPRTGRAERRRHANSCYRLGSKALRAGDLDPAGKWLRRAWAQGHPGAAFRLAVVLHRVAAPAPPDAIEVLELVRDAAHWGHGDAWRLLSALGLAEPGVSGPGAGAPGEEDPEFTPEVRGALAALGPPEVDGAADGTADGSRGVSVPDGGSLWSPAPLRPASVTDLAQQMPDETGAPQQWEAVQRILDVLDLIGGAGRPVGAERISRATGLPHQILEQLLYWLCEQGLAAATDDGGYRAGPVMLMMSGQLDVPPEQVLQQTLAGLRDAAGAAVYVSSYTDGEVRISRYADGPDTPKVHEWVDFRACAHASAVGKSLLAQLDFDGRMDHLSRRRPMRLTSRTITDRRELFRALDGAGPAAAQFDLLEYSTTEVCAAVPLGVAREADCVALSLPVAQRHRLVAAARTLSGRSAGLLLSLLLARSPSAGGAVPAVPGTSAPRSVTDLLGAALLRPGLPVPPLEGVWSRPVRHLASSGR